MRELSHGPDDSVTSVINFFEKVVLMNDITKQDAPSCPSAEQVVIYYIIIYKYDSIIVKVS